MENVDSDVLFLYNCCLNNFFFWEKMNTGRNTKGRVADPPTINCISSAEDRADQIKLGISVFQLSG